MNTELTIACAGHVSRSSDRRLPRRKCHSTHAIPVTADNFVRAESDSISANVVKDGGFGKF